jgi:hypothetical protein
MPIYHAKDNSFKLILGNHDLFVQFLRDFVPVDLLKDVQPEDIEDMDERFLPLFQDSKDSDTVKKINLKGDTPLFVIALVEHESKVNFRTSFKALLYICMILDYYEKDVNKVHKGRSSTKDFRYPPIIPIVFYDGPDPWTAETNFLYRTSMNDVFRKYIPSFEYELVDLDRYAKEDIIRFNDTLSLVMLVDRLRTPEDLLELEKITQEQIEALRLNIPPGLSKLLKDVITVLIDRVSIPKEQKQAVVEKLTGKEEQTMMFEQFVKAELKDKRRIRREALKEGQEKGRQKGKAEVAFKLKAQGDPIGKIADVTGLTPDEIKKL